MGDGQVAGTGGHSDRRARARVGGVPALVRACHPEPTAAVTVVAGLLAVDTGRPAFGVVAVALAVLASQLCTGWANDWLDAERDAAAGRRDKPIPAGRVSRRAVGRAAVIAGLATAPLALLSGRPAATVAVVGLVAALLYDWPLKNTAFSVAPWLVSFAALPAVVVLGGGGVPPWWLIAAGALLGGGAHFANALPDLAADAATGIRGLPHRLGAAGSRIAAAAALLAASAVLALGPPGPPSWFGLAVLVGAAVVLGTGLYAGRREGSRAAFRAVLAIALADVALLLASGAGR